jgi:hypothetical protein
LELRGHATVGRRESDPELQTEGIFRASGQFGVKDAAASEDALGATCLQDRLVALRVLVPQSTLPKVGDDFDAAVRMHTKAGVGGNNIVRQANERVERV